MMVKSSWMGGGLLAGATVLGWLGLAAPAQAQFYSYETYGPRGYGYGPGYRQEYYYEPGRSRASQRRQWMIQEQLRQQRLQQRRGYGQGYGYGYGYGGPGYGQGYVAPGYGRGNSFGYAVPQQVPQGQLRRQQPNVVVPQGGLARPGYGAPGNPYATDNGLTLQDRIGSSR